MKFGQSACQTLKRCQPGSGASRTWWGTRPVPWTALPLDSWPSSTTSSLRLTTLEKKLKKSTQTWRPILREWETPSGLTGMNSSLKIKSCKPGSRFTELLRQIHKIFVTWALKSWDKQGLKMFLKQISIKVNVNYCKERKLLIFYGWLLCKSNLKLQKILWICLRSFVNSHLGGNPI